MIELAARSEIAKLPCGAMEFADRGNGWPVLIFHSSPGGYDQSLALAGFLEDEGFRIIAPSRPGYLRTPLSTGSDLKSQAEAASQLLDHMEIPKVAVMGFGWGGPAAVEFAKHFPDRVSALVLVSAAIAELPPASGMVLPQKIAQKLGSDGGSSLFFRKVSRDPITGLGEAFDLTSSGDSANRSEWINAVLRNPGEVERFQEIILSMAPLSSRKSGLENDLFQPMPSLRELKPPVLLVHGGMDKAVPLLKTGIDRFSTAELFTLPEAGHLVLHGPGAPVAAKRVVDFLNLHSPKSPQGNTDNAE